MNPFKVGDEVEYVPVDAYIDMTAGKVYTATAINGDHVEVIDDAHDTHDIHCENFQLYTSSQVPSPYQGAMGAGNRAKARANPHGQHAPDYTAAVLGDALTDIADAVDDYDSRKANARVTSVGDFEAGQQLVYKDGTPTLTSLTVKRCTATCVWFEETYSAAFDPNEFKVEY